MKFDGYGATIRPSEPSKLASLSRQVIRDLCADLGAVDGPGPTMRRYGPTVAINVGDRMAAWIGASQDGLLYVEGKGSTSPRLVESIRLRHPGHSVPRVDVAEDYAGDGVFERLQALIRANKGVKTKGGYVALPDDMEDGRTWSAGTRGGVAYVRQYEPGKMKERAGEFARNAVRVELEARPHYARDKLAVAAMAPVEVWGLTAWSHRVGQMLTQCDLPRYEAQVRKYTFDGTTRYIATAFRRHFEEMLSNGEDIERTIRAVWEEEDQLGVSGS